MALTDKKQYLEQNRLYSPNSIYHGLKIGGILPLSKEALLRNQIDRLTDFIDYLFEHSEHCDHISQTDAWKEFEIYEQKNSIIANKIRDGRKILKEKAITDEIVDIRTDVENNSF